MTSINSNREFSRSDSYKKKRGSKKIDLTQSEETDDEKEDELLTTRSISIPEYAPNYENIIKDIVEESERRTGRMKRNVVEKELLEKVIETVQKRIYRIEQHLLDNPETSTSDISGLMPISSETQQKIDRLNDFAAKYIDRRRETKAQALINELLSDLHKHQMAIERDLIVDDLSEEDVEEDDEDVIGIKGLSELTEEIQKTAGTKPPKPQPPIHLRHPPRVSRVPRTSADKGAKARATKPSAKFTPQNIRAESSTTTVTLSLEQGKR